jgi:hypothetical protein
VSPVKYENGSYIPEDGIFIFTVGKTSNLAWKQIQFPKRCFLVLAIPEDDQSLETQSF